MQCRLSSDVYADVSTDHRKYPVFSGYMELLWITAICHWLQTTWLMMDNISHLIVSVWRLIAPPCSKWASKRPFISWNVLPLLVTWILWHLPRLVLSLVEWWEEAQGRSTFFKSSSNFLSLHWSSSWDKTWTNNCAITRLILWGHNNSQFLGNQSWGFVYFLQSYIQITKFDCNWIKIAEGIPCLVPKQTIHRLLLHSDMSWSFFLISFCMAQQLVRGIGSLPWNASVMETYMPSSDIHKRLFALVGCVILACGPQ